MFTDKRNLLLDQISLFLSLLAISWVFLGHFKMDRHLAMGEDLMYSTKGQFIKGLLLLLLS